MPRSAKVHDSPCVAETAEKGLSNATRSDRKSRLLVRDSTSTAVPGMASANLVSEIRQRKLRGCGLETLVPSPEHRLGREHDGGEKMHVDQIEPSAEQIALLDKVQHLIVGGGNGREQVVQRREEHGTIPDGSQRKFSDHHRMGQNLSVLQKVDQRRVGLV